jgi:hypothetical protein
MKRTVRRICNQLTPIGWTITAALYTAIITTCLMITD